MVNLVAPYRDAYFHILHDNPFTTTNGDTINYRYYSINSHTTWTSEKAHVVYGSVVIEPEASLTIEEGTDVYFHKNSGIYVDQLNQLINYIYLNEGGYCRLFLLI